MFAHYARKRLQAFLEQIDSLLNCEFPYSHSRDALQELDEFFKEELARLEWFSEHSNSEIVKHECVLALGHCFDYLPVLGFLLRSTNVRNAFEAFGPLLQLAQSVLGEETRLILSSEWEYSPLTYPSIPRLPGFVLIGLPAPESENPLLIPLAGHELGHSIWLRHDLEDEYSTRVRELIVESTKANWDEFREVFPDLPDDQDSLGTDTVLMESWEPAVPWALQQVEETFCDLVGVRVFGRAFLSAFAYLLSPNSESQRCEFYPSMRKRVANMVSAAAEYGIDCPLGFEDLFEGPSEPSLVPAHAFRLARSDDTLERLKDDLISKAGNLIGLANVELPEPSRIEHIATQLRKVAPAENSRSLADILNAAWQLSEDPDLWENQPQLFKKRERLLRELVLKNIDVFEVEQRWRSIS